MSDDFQVDFFCVGVAKAGTTTLHELLNLQEGIALPARKETNYFSIGIHGTPDFVGPLDNSSINEPTITSFDDYRADFDTSGDVIVGEVCPSYALPGVAARLHAHNPDAKIIILLREPVARAYSNYQHLVRDGREYDSFEDALAKEASRLDEHWEWFWGLKRNSLYADMVQEYFDVFGRDSVKILLFEDFIADQQSHLSDILLFLGMTADPANAPDVASNASGVVSGRWRVVHRMLLSEGIVNSILRRILPVPLRKRLGTLFKQFTTVKGGVSPETRVALTVDFRDDLERLNAMTAGQVDSWLGKQHVP